MLAINKVFTIWKKQLQAKKEVYVEYTRQYFVGDGRLTLGAGLLQIRDFAKETSNEELLKAFEAVNLSLKETKEEFNKLLHQKTGFNYFEVDEKKLRSSVSAVAPMITEEIKPSKGFDHTVDMRLALACKIVSEMNNTKEFSRVKFAKAFYLADVVSGVDLKTDYTREAAGPLDQRSLYNEKMGIEPLAAKHGFFDAEKKKGKEFDFVQYTTGPKLNNGTASFEKLFSKDAKKIENVIKLTSPMTRDQIEIVATLYACWNDLLIAKKKPSDQDLIREFKEKWHPEKTKKFRAEKNKKPRFTEKQLVDAIAWMKAKGLVPIGSGKKTKTKPSKDEVIPF